MVCGFQSSNPHDKILFLSNFSCQEEFKFNLKFSLFGRVTMKKKVEKPFPEKKDYYRDHSKLGRDLIKRKNDRLKSLLEDKRPDKY